MYEEDEKSRGWRDIREGEHELSGTLVVPGDNAVELIEKWKALIDTKDNIMKQKNIQIERLYYNFVCTVHVHVTS